MRDLNAFLAIIAGPAWDAGSGLACFERGRFLPRLAPDARLRGAVLADAAERELRKAIEKEVATASVFEELGAAIQFRGMPQQALECYSRGINLQPEHAALRRKRAWLLAQYTGDFEQSAADFATVLSVDPQDEEALSGLGYVAACQNLSESAEKFALQAVLYGGGDYLTLHNVACIYARLFRNSHRENKAYQEMATSLLNRDVELWQRGGRRGPDALRAIEADTELDVLHFTPPAPQP